MKSFYRATEDFWHKNLLVQTGEVLSLTLNEVKYLMHAVESVLEEAHAEVEAVVEAVVDEVKVSVSRRRARTDDEA